MFSQLAWIPAVLMGLYYLYSRIRDFYFDHAIAKEEKVLTGLEAKINEQDGVLKSAEEKAKESGDAYDKAKSDYDSGK